MMLAMFASLLLAAAAQQPEPTPADSYEPAPEATYQPADYDNGEAPAEENLQPMEPVEPEQPVADGPVEEAAEAAEDVDMVCRRTTYYDDFGRQRARRSCRPRDDF